jgi:hypothetical protein
MRCKLYTTNQAHENQCMNFKNLKADFSCYLSLTKPGRRVDNIKMDLRDRMGWCGLD